MKIGELARNTGISVRTLHYYDEIRLLSPSQYTEGGHRLYSKDDVARLQQIIILKQLGFSLQEVHKCLQEERFTLYKTIELHIARLRQQIELQRRLCQRLENLAGHLSQQQDVSIEEFVHTIKEITMIEKYYTTEQLEELKERGRTIGKERIREVEQEWPKLIARMREEMEKGTDPTNEVVLQLARRSRELVKEFSGGNPEIEKALGKMYRQEPSVREMTGLDSEVFAYMDKANAALEARQK